MKCTSRNSVGFAGHAARSAHTFAWSIALVAIASQTACLSVSPTYEDGFLIEKINRQYAVRDNCLRRAAAEVDAAAARVQALGSLVAQSCGTEARRLVELISPRRDPEVTARIAEDSASRAAGYVLEARRAKAASDR